jgi:hypothetical protein
VEPKKYQHLLDVRENLSACTTEHLFIERLELVKKIVSEHRDKGLIGLVKFNFFRDTKSKKAFDQFFTNEMDQINLKNNHPRKCEENVITFKYNSYLR